MSSLNVAVMREMVSDAYEGPKWKAKVSDMSDRQVMAIYYSFCEKGKFDEEPKKRTVKPKKTREDYETWDDPVDYITPCGDSFLTVFYNGATYDVIDISNTSYIVFDENDLLNLPKELCEVI